MDQARPLLCAFTRDALTQPLGASLHHQLSHDAREILDWLGTQASKPARASQPARTHMNRTQLVRMTRNISVTRLPLGVSALLATLLVAGCGGSTGTEGMNGTGGSSGTPSSPSAGIGTMSGTATYSTTSGIQVTPLTSMAQARARNMAGGMTAANISAANTAISSYFSVGDVLHTMPMNPLTSGSAASASQDAKNYGMAIAAMSEYAKTIGMTAPSAGVITAMMDDATDGTLNGMMGSAAISMSGMGGIGGGMMGSGGVMMQPNAGTLGMATAMTDFVDDAGVNRSGATFADMQPLIAKLTTSTGTIQ